MKILFLFKTKFQKFIDYYNEGYLFRKLYYLSRLSDIVDYIVIRRKNKLIPLSRNIWGGPALNSLAFYKWGLGDLNLFKKFANITEESKVLDVGCGIGRVSIAFTEFLNDQGSYDGFDANTRAIEWCQRINKQYPNFNFKHTDLYNSFYNPNGKIKSEHFVFPYEDNSFDFCFLISVFTHMLPGAVNNYLKEIERVLRKDGTCFITFFILNESSRSTIENNKAAFSFKNNFGHYSIQDLAKPEFAIAYNEEYVNELFHSNNLNINQPILYGSWNGKTDYNPILKSKIAHAQNFTLFQDIVIAKKQ